jgi:hypothetical protein
MDFYDAVYSQDNPEGPAHGWIQWKGTEVCIDLHCVCGNQSHFDGDFFYHYKCPKCGAKYAVGQVIKLIPLTKEQVKIVERSKGGFKDPNPEMIDKG